MFGLSEIQLMVLVKTNTGQVYEKDDLKALHPNVTDDDLDYLVQRGILMTTPSGERYFSTMHAEGLVEQGFMHMLQTLKDISYAAHLRRHAQFFDMANQAINWKGK